MSEREQLARLIRSATQSASPWANYGYTEADAIIAAGWSPPTPETRGEGRDYGGRLVREAWVRWALTQPNPKPTWLVPYDDLSEPDKEADRQIAEALWSARRPAPEALGALRNRWFSDAQNDMDRATQALEGDYAERRWRMGRAYGLRHAAEQLALALATPLPPPPAAESVGEVER